MARLRGGEKAKRVSNHVAYAGSEPLRFAGISAHVEKLASPRRRRLPGALRNDIGATNGRRYELALSIETGFQQSADFEWPDPSLVGKEHFYIAILRQLSPPITQSPPSVIFALALVSAARDANQHFAPHFRSRTTARPVKVKYASGCRTPVRASGRCARRSR